MSTLLDNLHRLSQIAGDAFAEDVAAFARDLDTTPRQITVLAAVAAAADDPPSQTRLVETTGIDRSTLADLVRRLVDKGWLRRQRCRQDARAYEVRLTDVGRAALEAADPARLRVERELIQRFPALAAIRGLDIPVLARATAPAAARTKRRTYTPPATAAATGGR